MFSLRSNYQLLMPLYLTVFELLNTLPSLKLSSLIPNILENKSFIINKTENVYYRICMYDFREKKIIIHQTL